MNPGRLTAAHRSLRFGTRLRVTNSRNGRAVVVRVNDRGPFIRGRVLDLSRAAATSIGMVSSGTARVCYEIIG
jgi:rare lipoprotein A